MHLGAHPILLHSRVFYNKKNHTSILTQIRCFLTCGNMAKGSIFNTQHAKEKEGRDNLVLDQVYLTLG